MAEIEIHYGVIFGKGDASDWIDWTMEVDDEELEIYERDRLLMIDPNTDPQLKDCLERVYEEIEDEEIQNGIDFEEEYVLECQGMVPVAPDDINELVAKRDAHTLEYFGLTDMTDEELENWDANDLDELPDVRDFEENFEPSSPYSAGWILNIEFDELPDLTEESAREALKLLFGEGDFAEVTAYLERAAEYMGWDEEWSLEQLAEDIAGEMNCATEYAKYRAAQDDGE